MNSNEEMILCSSVNELPRLWLPESGSVAVSESDLWRELNRSIPAWLPRSQAETDPRYKQWIPYSLIRASDGRFGTYARRGRESRLSERWSLGVGGHVNPCDWPSTATNSGSGWRDALWNGLRRELAEEFPTAAEGTTQFLGIVHESTSEVGRVHIGAVFLHLPRTTSGEPGPELTNFQWLALDLIGTPQWPGEQLELWSRLAIQLLPRQS